MGKKPQPSEEELEFVYERIRRGLSNAEIMSEMGDEEFPRRDNPRYFRQRRREFNAAKRVLAAKVLAEQAPFQESHRRELVYFGQLLRDRLSPLGTELLTNPWVYDTSQMLWDSRSPYNTNEEQRTGVGDVDKHWGWNRYDARSHPLFASFQAHIGSGHSCWSVLDQLQAAYDSFCAEVEECRKKVREELERRWSKVGAAVNEQAVAAISLEAFYEVSRPRPEKSPASTSGLIIETDGPELRLRKGAWVISSSPEYDRLEQLKEAVTEMDRALPDSEELKELGTTYQRLGGLVKDFKQHLTPDASLRALIARGRCEFCLEFLP